MIVADLWFPVSYVIRNKYQVGKRFKNIPDYLRKLTVYLVTTVNMGETSGSKVYICWFNIFGCKRSGTEKKVFRFKMDMFPYTLLRSSCAVSKFSWKVPWFWRSLIFGVSIQRCTRVVKRVEKFTLHGLFLLYNSFFVVNS